MVSPEFEQPQSADAELVARAQEGDELAFAELYNKTHRLVFSRIRNKVGDIDTAEDLKQSTYLRAFRSLGNYQDQGKEFMAWLATISDRLVSDHYGNAYTRRQDPTYDMEAFEDYIEPDGSYDTERRVMASAALADAFSVMSDREIDLVQHTIIDDMPHNSYAESRQLSEGAIKQLTFRMRAKLKRELGDIDDLLG